jgi:hypothetical protein
LPSVGNFVAVDCCKSTFYFWSKRGYAGNNNDYQRTYAHADHGDRKTSHVLFIDNCHYSSDNDDYARVEKCCDHTDEPDTCIRCVD